MVNGLSLAAGIGGLDLALHLVVHTYQTITYVEIDPACRRILEARMVDSLLSPAPLWDDLRTFDARPYRGVVDILHAGYPCQPFSIAGKRRGVSDPRHLWPDIARVMRECIPTECFFENVTRHLRIGFDVVASDLVAMGYSVTAGLFTAAEVGALHRRQRLYILGHRRIARSCRPVPDADRIELWKQWERVEAPEHAHEGSTVAHDDVADRLVADSARSGLEERRQTRTVDNRDLWTIEPDVGRVAHGIPARVDRLRALGNAVVPLVAATAWIALHETL